MEFIVGDVVEVTDNYIANYPSWSSSIKDKEIVVRSIKERIIKSKDLGALDKVSFQSMYGNLEQFPLCEMMVSVDGALHMVSQFGFKKKV